MNAQLQVRLLKLGHLLPVSVVNVTNYVPQPLTNEERIRLLRPFLEVPTYNEYNWLPSPLAPHTADFPAAVAGGNSYAYDETLDGREPSTDTHWSE